jgi:hypothetical protein
VVVFDVTAKRKIAREYIDLLGSGRRPSTRSSARSVVATSRRSRSLGGSPPAPGCCCSWTRPAASTSAPAGEINALWQQLAANGYTIVLASSKVEELAEVCDRILVLPEGRIVSEHAGERVTEDQLLHAAGGF